MALVRRDMGMKMGRRRQGSPLRGAFLRILSDCAVAVRGVARGDASREDPHLNLPLQTGEEVRVDSRLHGNDKRGVGVNGARGGWRRCPAPFPARRPQGTPLRVLPEDAPTIRVGWRPYGFCRGRPYGFCRGRPYGFCRMAPVRVLSDGARTVSSSAGKRILRRARVGGGVAWRLATLPRPVPRQAPTRDAPTNRPCESHLRIAPANRTYESPLRIAPTNRTCESHLRIAPANRPYETPLRIAPRGAALRFAWEGAPLRTGYFRGNVNPNAALFSNNLGEDERPMDGELCP